MRPKASPKGECPVRGRGTVADGGRGGAIMRVPTGRHTGRPLQNKRSSVVGATPRGRPLATVSRAVTVPHPPRHKRLGTFISGGTRPRNALCGVCPKGRLKGAQTAAVPTGRHTGRPLRNKRSSVVGATPRGRPLATVSRALTVPHPPRHKGSAPSPRGRRQIII